MYFLTAGLAAGFHLGINASRSMVGIFDMTETGYYAEYLDTQFAEGTDTSREEAIHSTLCIDREAEIQKHRPFHPESASQRLGTLMCASGCISKKAW